MRLITFLLAVAASSAALAISDPGGLDAALRKALADFVAEEVEDADTPELQQAMVECIYPVFEGIAEEMIAQVLAEDDFERGLGIVLTAYPEREEIIETCEDRLG
jgi:hypothetical protein